MDSILNSVKKMLGIEAEDTNFDTELIFHINTVLGVCFQLGVGPTDEPFMITGANEIWEDFIPEDQIVSVQTYVFIKVKLIFDPPSSSFVLSSYQDLAKEFEWRCNVDSETH